MDLAARRAERGTGKEAQTPPLSPMLYPVNHGPRLQFTQVNFYCLAHMTLNKTHTHKGRLWLAVGRGAYG